MIRVPFPALVAVGLGLGLVATSCGGARQQPVQVPTSPRPSVKMTAGPLRAGVDTGVVEGVVRSGGKPLAGTTVVVGGPASSSDRTEFSDSAGRFVIDNLPPGEYYARFYYSSTRAEQPKVLIVAGGTIGLEVDLPKK